ncbi:MAG: RecX family transcriptional regulator [Lachnospiraceae bacterium]|nr:RecX family transcriptional regulator [Lachnospiraceae bacterium]
MTVTGIKEITKSRMKIEIDGAFAFVLYKGELRIYGIKEDKELSEENYQKILTEVLPKRAKLRAMNLLKSRTYTAVQLKEKLETGGYPKKIIEDAIAYVASFGYINDSQYAMDFIEYNKEKKSKNRIFMDLYKKGIPKELIEEAWEDVVGEDRLELEKKQIIHLIHKKNYSLETASLQEKHKMLAFLYRKGFSNESIRSVLSLDITTI